MFFRAGIRSFLMGAALAATVGLGACGGGSSSSSSSSNVLNLSSGVQSEHVARYAAAFGLLGGPGVATIYASIAQTFITDLEAGSVSGTTSCPSGGSFVTSLQDASDTGLVAGESATVTFSSCVGQIEAPAVSSTDSANGTITLQVQSVTGTVGSTTANWSFTALESTSNLTLTSSSGTTTVNGAVTFTMSYDASTGLTTTTASAPTVTIGSTITSANITGTITASALSFTHVHGTTTNTLTSSGSIGVSVSDATMAFNLSTPTAVTIAEGELAGGTLQLSSSNATETIAVQNSSTVVLTVTANGQTASYTESLSDLEGVLGS
jgi:hypothetical protein